MHIYPGGPPGDTAINYGGEEPPLLRILEMVPRRKVGAIFHRLKALVDPAPPCTNANSPQCMSKDSICMIDYRDPLHLRLNHNRN